MVKNGASCHKTNCIDIFSEILNPEGHQNCCIVSKVTTILLNGGILPTGGVASGRVFACSPRSRLVFVECSAVQSREVAQCSIGKAFYHLSQHI